MVKLLDQKGLCLEEFFRFSDIEVTGRVSRNAFEKIIRNVGLSCNSKDLARIVAYYSEGIKFDIVNYHAFLKDADVQIKNEQKQHTSVKDLPSSIQRTWSARIRVLLDVRCMLMEVTSKMKRQKDFVTGMFTKWDSDMIGSVTSIQLIRVLIQLRVILTEKDQDILIGFLDSTSSGRVDYKYLLEFCFPKFDSKLSIISNIPDSQNNADLKQIKFPGKIQNGCDRIIVVQPSAVPISDQIDHGHPNKDHIHPMNSAKVVGNISESPVLVSYVEEHTFEQHQVTHNLPLLCPDNQCIEKTSIDKKLHLRNGGFSEASNLQRDIFAPMLDTLEQGYTINNSKVESEENDYQDESFDVSLSENEMFEGDVGSLESIEANATFGQFQNMISDCSHDTNRTIHGTNAEFIALKIKQGRMRNQGELREDDSFLRPSSDGDDVFNVGCKYQAAEDLSAEGDPRTLGPSSDNMPSEEDLRFSANKTLSTVRDMVLVRHRAGKPLTEIFRHFDRIGKNFFDAKDFLIATADLRINISNRVAAIAVELIALDGREHVSLGEFLVYILDPNHRILQDSIVKQMAEQLDKQGRVFQTLFRSLFRDKVKPLNRALLQADGFISIRAFLSSLRKLGLALTQIDISRLVRRFDTNGTGITCSAVRFIHMIEKSDVWEESEGILVDHEIALNESAMLRTQLVSIQHSNDITSQLDILNSQDIDKSVDLDLDLDEDMICMAEYLGIKVISEPHLLWIVRDAVTSQLPSPWILKKVE